MTTPSSTKASDSPLVTVVIPTRGRPALLVRAIESVLLQTMNDLEVIVVIDGEDGGTVTAIQSISSPQVRHLQLPNQLGGSRARNEGVHAALGYWVAFLDDDDEWLPEKLEKQLAAARSSQSSDPIVGSKVMARTSAGEFVWPRKLPTEPLSEYLLARNSWSQGEGLLQTSTLITTRRLLLQIGFLEGLKKHQDWDWLLRAIRMPGAKIEFVPEPLAVWHLEQSHDSVSRKQDWRGSLNWIRERRSLVTRRAYAGFIATQIASQASRQGHWRAFVPLLAEMFQKGSPKPIDLCLLLGMWLVPIPLRERLRSL